MSKSSNAKRDAARKALRTLRVQKKMDKLKDLLAQFPGKASYRFLKKKGFSSVFLDAHAKIIRNAKIRSLQRLPVANDWFMFFACISDVFVRISLICFSSVLLARIEVCSCCKCRMGGCVLQSGLSAFTHCVEHSARTCS